MANMTDYDAALREDYLPVIREQLNNKILLLSQLEKNTDDIVGRYAVFVPHLTRGYSVGGRADGGTLPNAISEGYDDGRVLIKHNYARLQLTGPVMRASKTDRGAIERALDSEMRIKPQTLKRDINRQAAGTADGVIAATEVTGASTTVVLAALTTLVQFRQLEVGMHIDIGTVAAPTTIASDRTILSSSSAVAGAFTITISGAAVTTAVTDRIFNTGAGGATGGVGQKELSGLQSIVDSTGTIFNIAQSSFPAWASTELANGGVNRALTEQLMSRLADDVDIAGGSELNLYIGSHGVVRSYEALLTAQKGFYNTLELKGGHSALEFAHGSTPKPVVADKDIPENTLFGLTTSHMREAVQSDYEWMDEDGAILCRAGVGTSGVDAYEATMYRDHEVYTDKRNAHGKILDLTSA